MRTVAILAQYTTKSIHMQFWEVLFFTSCFLVFYNYAGYAIIAYGLNKLKKRRPEPVLSDNELPTISFIVAAYNEEDFIEKKILNSLEQDYPKERIEFIFVADGSSDSTPEIISRFPSVRLLYQPQRLGKSAAVNRAVAEAKNDILVFNDANTFLNTDACRKIARHYKDEYVGGVAGEKKVISANAGESDAGEGEGLYWKYESALKKIDSDFHSVVGAAGELFSVRRSLYHPIDGNIILDDFVISLRIVMDKRKVVYEPGAYAAEAPSSSIKEEKKRKIRISAGGFQAMAMLGPLFKFWNHPRLSFLYISHRVMRWTVSPVCLILAFISNLVISIDPGYIAYKIMFVCQLAFYLLSAMSFFKLPGRLNQSKLLKLPYYFTFMNVSVVLGFFRYLKGQQSAIWEKAKRVN